MATRSSRARSGTGEGIAPSAYASAPRVGGSIFRRGAGVLPDGGSHEHTEVRIIIHLPPFFGVA